MNTVKAARTDLEIEYGEESEEEQGSAWGQPTQEDLYWAKMLGAARPGIELKYGQQPEEEFTWQEPTREDSHYNTLGISEHATRDEIRKAFLKLSKRYHPDRNPEGKEMFQKINAAYQVLSDPQQRHWYDVMEY